MGLFYIVATPIGNYKDITYRAVEILSQVDFIVCEHEKEFKKLFSVLKIDEKKYIVSDKKREESTISIVIDLLKKGENGAIISDCGTPLFEDPGFNLIDSIRREKFSIVSIPGANSLITAITLAPFQIKKYYFAGFISREKNEREKEVNKLLSRKETVILMESPHRLQNILELLEKYASNRTIFIPINLTLESEKLYYGNVKTVKKMIISDNIEKCEFLIVIKGEK